MKTFTKQFMMDNCGCYSEKQLMSCSFMQAEIITLESIFKSEIPLKDKFWFYCKKVASKEQSQKLAIGVAEIVLPIYEEKYPENKAPREAIEAAKLYLAGHLSLNNLLLKRRAAYDAAYAAAYTADAAAYAAAYTADAAAYAAYAAAYAADAADAADAYYKQKLEDYLLNLLNTDDMNAENKTQTGGLHDSVGFPGFKEAGYSQPLDEQLEAMKANGFNVEKTENGILITPATSN